MKRILLFFGLLFLANILIGQTTQKDTVNVKPFEDLTLVTDGTVDTSDQFLMYDISAGLFSFRLSLGELLKKAIDVPNIVGSSQIVNGSILDTDISGSAGIGLNKLATTAAGRLLLTDSGGAGTWVSGTPGYGLTISGTSMLADTSQLATQYDLTQVSGGGGGLTTIDTTEAFASELFFFENRQVGTYTVSSNLTFTVNDSAAVPGAFQTIRANFGAAPGYTVTFSGADFDSVQFFNIGSGDTLDGYHILGFEWTKWGAAVYCPTNATTGGSGGSVDPGTLSVVDSIGSLAHEWDATLDVDTVGGGLRWTDQKAGIIAANGGMGTPTWDGTNVVFTNDALKMDSTVTMTGGAAYTIGFAGDQDNTGDNSIWGDTATTNYSYLMLRSTSTATNITSSAFTGFTNHTGNTTIMVICDGANCKLYQDNTLVDTKTQVGTTQTIKWLGEWFSHANGKRWDGNWNHFFISRKAYTDSDRNAWFNDVNTRFSLGL